ncbi:MAG: hypothetical protein CMJ64_22370 [Planctomycetaceae bacterium]|nr:hypothetical protein [Planctomycetaceae bacterium]
MSSRIQTSGVVCLFLVAVSAIAVAAYRVRGGSEPVRPATEPRSEMPSIGPLPVGGAYQYVDVPHREVTRIVQGDTNQTVQTFRQPNGSTNNLFFTPFFSFLAAEAASPEPDATTGKRTAGPLVVDYKRRSENVALGGRNT